MLVSLVGHPHIEHGAEHILTNIAVTWPEKVIDFFDSRLTHEPAASAPVRYEAIPFRFHDLKGPLGKIPAYVIGKARGWFARDQRLFAYRGGRLVTDIFPTLTSDIERALGVVVQSGRRDDAEFVIKILRNYEGKGFIHELCKTLVAMLPEDDPILREIDIALDSTGVVRGEFGLVEAYRSKLADLDPWLNDPRERVRSFAKRHAASLE